MTEAALDASQLHAFPVLRDMVDNGSCGAIAQEPRSDAQSGLTAPLWRLEQLLAGFSTPAPGSKPYRGAFLASTDDASAGPAIDLAKKHGLDSSLVSSAARAAGGDSEAARSSGEPGGCERELACRAAELLSAASPSGAGADVVWVYAAAEGTGSGGALGSADRFFCAEGAVAEPVAEALPESMRHLFPRQSRAFCAGEYNAEVTLRECLFGVHFLPGVVRKDAAMVSDVDNGPCKGWLRFAGRGAVSARQTMPEILSRMTKFPKYGA